MKNQLSLGYSSGMIDEWMESHGIHRSIAGLSFKPVDTYPQGFDQTRQGVLRLTENGAHELLISSMNIWSTKDLDKICVVAGSLHLKKAQPGRDEAAILAFISDWSKKARLNNDLSEGEIAQLVNIGVAHAVNSQAGSLNYIDVPTGKIHFNKQLSEAIQLAAKADEPLEISESPREGPKVAQPSVKEDKGDIGSYVSGARKEKSLLEDILKNINTDQDAKNAHGVVTREKIWPKPDYKHLAKEYSPEYAYAVKVAYGLVKPVPYFGTLKDIDLYVSITEGLRDCLSNNEITPESLKDELIELCKEHELFKVKGAYYMQTPKGRGVSKIASDRLVKFAGTSVPSRKMLRKKESEFELGWPEKLPPWLIGFEIVESSKDGFDVRSTKVEGKKLKGSPFKTFDDAEFALQERHYKQSLYVAPDAYNKVKYAVFKDFKSGDTRYLKGDFDTKVEAQEFLNQNAMELAEQPKQRIVREGLRDIWREGSKLHDEKITLEDFVKKFGFKGVQFGASMPQDERLENIRYADSAFSDLAELLDLPTRAMSLDGNLSLAFGSRGMPNSSAHYEPGKKIINFTRKNGAGSAAHEWWHALDNFLATYEDGSPRGFLTDGRVRNHLLPDGLSEAFVNITKAIKEKVPSVEEYKAFMIEQGEVSRNSLEQTFEQLKKLNDEVINEQSVVKKDNIEISKLIEDGLLVTQDGSALHRMTEDDGTLKPINDIKRLMDGGERDSGVALFSLHLSQAEQTFKDLHNKVREALKPSDELRLNMKVPTRYFISSLLLDDGRLGTYFSKDVELTARAFERFVQDELELKEAFNDYLVNGLDNSSYLLPLYPVQSDEKVVFREKIKCATEKVANCVRSNELNMEYHGEVKTDRVDLRKELTNKLTAKSGVNL